MKNLKTILILLVATTTLISCKKEVQIDDNSVTKSTDSISEIKNEVSKEVEENYCFLQVFKKDTTRVNLTINGTDVKGTMDILPYQKDSARGTLQGTKNENGELEVLYSYMIEGNNQTETKILKVENDKLLIKKGELLDLKNDGNLTYKDVSKAKFSEEIPKTECK